ncbi:hypothetical protein [Paenibacillus alkalitolerans]|uniref:hypothetical protein n=1 Tax=Paenibacillus alkalitolerans TaxID=2799335 RepID=UPI0018F52CB3|nr:hypothetical protein [Paenibacillus alkalitolerans]
MKKDKGWKFGLLLTVMVLMLSACMGNNANNETGEGERQPPAAPENGADASPGDTETGTTDGGTDQTPDEGKEAGETDAADLPETKNLEFELEGMPESVPAKLTRSDQGYAFYLMEGFEFTPEEPGKDLIFHKQFPEFYSRVEMLPADMDLNELKANAEETLKLIGEVVSQEGANIFDENIRKNAKFFYHASNAELSKNIIVIENNGALFRYTLNFPNSEAAEGVSPRFYPMINSFVVTR